MLLSTPKLEIAVFLDFDGTLVEIAERPDGVRVADVTRATLTDLQAFVGGALAIVTGREIETIDALLFPFRCPVAGIHGLSRRDAAGLARNRIAVPTFLDVAELRLADLALSFPGLIVERKSRAIALHYRTRPELEHVCLAAMERIAAGELGLNLVRGKMVIEVRPGGGDKGTAIADFLAEPPFRGRVPLFAGDDVTDEDAFRMVNALNGVTVKIGPGETVARHRLPDSAAFVAWLGGLADRLEKGEPVA